MFEINKELNENAKIESSAKISNLWTV